MQTQDIEKRAGFLAHKGQACPEKPSFNKNQADPVQPSFNKNQADHVPYFNKNQAGLVLPPIQGTPYLDPSITYTIQMVNAAADAIFRMCHVLDAVEPERFCGYYEQIESYGCAVTDIVDHLIDFAGHFAKASL